MEPQATETTQVDTTTMDATMQGEPMAAATTAHVEVLHDGLMYEPKFWLALAFVTLFVLLGGKLLRAINSLLDKRAAKIADELEQAKNLRAEAASLKAGFQKKLNDSMAETEAIISEARAQAARMVNNAEDDIKSSLERRLHSAMERIALREKHAFESLKNQVVDTTMAAATLLVAEHFANISNAQMIQHITADLDSKTH